MKDLALNRHRVLVPSDGWSSGWFEWIDIRQIPDYEGCGVYQIRLVNSEELPVEIPRFIDTDKDGILQICYSENIKRGIYRFVRATEGKRYTHAEGERLQLLKKYTNFKERYKDCKMQYSFKEQLNRREARIEQERLLKYYVKKYGEVPPNNNNFPDKHIDWESLRDSHTTQPVTFPDLIYDMSPNLYPIRLSKTRGNI
ncbi:MAG: hypothetical protein LUQ22_07425 [Methanotrichaceae archaeon]|nr:hypothetical protein [Methanotrichaceae archaeon]